MFNEVIGVQDVGDQEILVHKREAVRAIILHKQKILLVHSNLGDYKFPGGGVEENESHAQSLVREVAEETGYVNTVAGEKVGVVLERHVDAYDEDALFEMTSNYYLCEVKGHRAEQQLDDYEREQQFTPEWISLDEAIDQNEKVLDQSASNRWIQRENFVLRELKKWQKKNKV